MTASVAQQPPVPAWRALLESVVDYAGLFPPAGLDMVRAVHTYAAHKAAGSGWMLGRFVLPIGRIGEFLAAASAMPTEAGSPAHWRLSAIAGVDVSSVLGAIRDVNGRPRGAALGTIDSVEIVVSTDAQVAEAASRLPAGVTLVCEVPAGAPSLAPILAALRDAGGVAKIRTGGTTPDAIPPVEAVAGFLAACVLAGVPFKATAGLHHPVRSVQPLTYAANSPRAEMHGFLNVFVAAAATLHLAVEGRPGIAATIRGILAETDPARFVLGADAVEWRHVTVPRQAVAAARARFALSFGSCSFEEPVAGLRHLGVPL